MDLQPCEPVLKAIKKAGYKTTPQRRALINLLLATGKPLTVAEICRVLQQEFPDMSNDTVYRNLRLLVDLGLVAQIRAGTAYNDCFEILTEHHYHLVCLGCGAITCLPDCPVSNWQPPAEILENFQVTGHSFEIHGFCHRCRQRGVNKGGYSDAS